MTAFVTLTDKTETIQKNEFVRSLSEYRKGACRPLNKFLFGQQHVDFWRL